MKIKTFLLVIIALAVVMSILYFAPVKIRRTYNGCIYSPDPGHEEQVSITLMGMLYRRLLSPDYIHAVIEINDMKFDLSSSMPSESIVENIQLKTSQHNYLVFSTEVNEGMTRTKGSVWISKDFKQIWGSMDFSDERYKANLYFAGPCKNAREANKIAESFMR